MEFCDALNTYIARYTYMSESIEEKSGMYRYIRPVIDRILHPSTAGTSVTQNMCLLCQDMELLFDQTDLTFSVADAMLFLSLARFKKDAKIRYKELEEETTSSKDLLFDIPETDLIVPSHAYINAYEKYSKNRTYIVLSYRSRNLKMDSEFITNPTLILPNDVLPLTLDGSYHITLDGCRFG